MTVALDDAFTINRTRTTVKVFVIAGEIQGSYADEYGRRGNVWFTADGHVLVEIHTDPVHYAYPMWKFHNYVAFDAYRREIDYVDREHRLPGVNPHRMPWVLE